MTGRTRTPRLVFASCMVLLLAALVLPRVAMGETVGIAGLDYYYGAGEPSDTVDILTVTGAADQTVFVEMERDGSVIASHLAFTLGESTSQRDDSGRYVGVVSATISDFRPSSTYTVRVFADRDQSQMIYEGTISPVYANLAGKEKLLALRTRGAENREFRAPGSISSGNATYRLASETPVSASPLTYAYDQADSAESVNGAITYVDGDGNVLRTDAIENIAKGTSRTVSIPSVITVGEGSSASFWRTVNFTGSVVATYPGTSDFTVRCVPLALGGGSANAGNYYFAGIRFVDASTGARVLAPSDANPEHYDDSLNVCGRYLYTPPTKLYVTGKGGVVDTYVLRASASGLGESGALELNSSSDGVTSGFKTYDIAYEKLPSDAEATWTVVLVNGAADPKSPEREIGRQTFTVKPGESASFVPQAKYEVGGTTYVPVASTKSEYGYTYGAAGQSPVTTIYYVPEGYVAPEPYDITVRYVNIANGEILQEQSLTARPELRDELEIASPQTFAYAGAEYVRLDGQEASIWHSYYSSNRVYTIYYRDVNDNLSANIVITRVNVEYVDGAVDGTTGAAAGATSPEDTSGANATATADGVAAVTVPATEGGLTAIDGGDNSRMVDGEGRDTNTMRIEDDETPLASLNGASGGIVSLLGGRGAVVAGVAVAAALVLACVVFLVYRRRRKDHEDEA